MCESAERSSDPQLNVYVVGLYRLESPSLRMGLDGVVMVADRIRGGVLLGGRRG